MKIRAAIIILGLALMFYKCKVIVPTRDIVYQTCIITDSCGNVCDTQFIWKVPDTHYVEKKLWRKVNSK